MGDVVSGVTGALGLTDKGAQGAASGQSDYYARESIGLSKAELEFQKEQYAEWKDIYGPLQEDLGTYFKNLTGEDILKRTDLEVTEIQKAGQEAQSQVDIELAQRGMTGSGLEAEAVKDITYGTEMEKGKARARGIITAEDEVMSKKAGFLALGLGQGTQMLQTSANVASNAASSIAGMSNTAQNASTSLAVANMKGNQFFMDQATDIAGSYFGS